MAQQGNKQMRVVASDGFVYRSVKLVLLANGNKYEVDSNTCFLIGEALHPFGILPCPNSYLSWLTRASVQSVVWTPETYQTLGSSIERRLCPLQHMANASQRTCLY
jgi:hypothetical protein